MKGAGSVLRFRSDLFDLSFGSEDSEDDLDNDEDCYDDSAFLNFKGRVAQ